MIDHRLECDDLDDEDDEVCDDLAVAVLAFREVPSSWNESALSATDLSRLNRGLCLCTSPVRIDLNVDILRGWSTC